MKKYIHYLAIFTMSLTFLLIFVGALVKSTEAGLSVPDWPTTFGKNMFLFPLSSMVGGILYEHSHRLIASFVGFCILINTILIQLSNHQKYIKILTLIALLAVIIQGILGGLTVLYFLPAWISASHATLGQSTFCLTIILAVITSPKWENFVLSKNKTHISSISIYATISVWFQLIIGAIVRHTESGLVALDFPKMNNEWIPSFSNKSIIELNENRFIQNFDSSIDLDFITSSQLFIHYLHRCWGYVIFVFILYFAYLLYKKNNYKYISIILCFLISTQVGLGALTVLSLKQFLITSLHVSNGAAILGLLTYITTLLHKTKI